jgi:hypothetical protein
MNGSSSSLKHFACSLLFCSIFLVVPRPTVGQEAVLRDQTPIVRTPEEWENLEKVNGNQIILDLTDSPLFSFPTIKTSQVDSERPTATVNSEG